MYGSMVFGIGKAVVTFGAQAIGQRHVWVLSGIRIAGSVLACRGTSVREAGAVVSRHSPPESNIS